MKKFKEVLFDEDAVGYLKLMAMLRLSTFDLLIVCALQVIIGFTVVAFLDMPLSVFGYLLVIGAAYTLKTVPAIRTEKAKAESPHHQEP